MLTIVCESYWPEVTSTAQLITELAENLISDFDVELLTTQPRFNSTYEKRPATETKNNVLIRRLPATNFAKTSKAGRLTNWLSFFASLTFAVSCRWRRRTYLFLTNPPTAPWALVLARWLKQPAYVLVYDLYPDLATAIGAVKKDNLLATGFDLVNRFAFRQASGLIALGEDMRTRLKEKVGDKTPISIIPNWANGEMIKPSPKKTSNFAQLHGLEDRLVFLYAGNLGLFQDLETLVSAVESLPDDATDPVLVFVGNGGKRKKIESLARGSTRIKVFDYVPYEDIGDLYAAADIGMIALEPGVAMTNVPSKTYSILAAGKPFLAVADESTDLKALELDGCGVCVPNVAAEVAQAMRRFQDSPALIEAMAAKSREVFDDRFSQTIILQRYRELLSSGSNRRAA